MWYLCKGYHLRNYALMNGWSKMLGAIIGDIVGSAYINNNLKKKEFPLFTINSSPTDDTIMTLAVCDCIQKNYQNNKQMTVETLKKWGRNYDYFGYGKRFYDWLFSDSNKAYGSCGNKTHPGRQGYR